MRFVFGSARSYKKRFVWAPVIFTCLILFLTEVSKRVSYFMDYPSTINIISTYSDEIIFPAVTICNQNDFRRTLALKNGHYNVLAHLFSEQFLSSMPLSESEMNISLRDLYANNAHDKKDMIVRCLFKGQPCTPENFTSTLTNYGQCYTFNGDKNNPHTIDSPGLSNALHLLINTEEYDNMEGSHVGGGIKVLLHRQDEFPLPNEYGHSLPTGRQGFLDVTLSMENLLPAPYGYCKDIPGQFLGNYSYSKEACKVACQNTFIMKKCGCRLFFMPSSNDSMQVCKVQDSQCISQAKERLRTFVTNAVGELRKDRSPSECLLELLTSYDNSVQWYQIIGQLFDTQPPGYCYTIRKQLMDSMNRFHINASVWYDVLSDINKIVDISQRYKDSTEINKMFYRNNFLGLKILFHDLDYDVLTQQQAYDVYALLGDLGGAMGLFIGASIISMFEIADFIVKIFHIVFKRKKAIKDANM